MENMAITEARIKGAYETVRDKLDTDMYFFLAGMHMKMISKPLLDVFAASLALKRCGFMKFTSSILEGLIGRSDNDRTGLLYNLHKLGSFGIILNLKYDNTQSYVFMLGEQALKFFNKKVKDIPLAVVG